MKQKKKVRSLSNENVINFFTKKNIDESPLNSPDIDWEEDIHTKVVDLVQILLYALRVDQKITVPDQYDPNEEQFTRDMALISVGLKSLLEHHYGVGPTATTQWVESIQERLYRFKNDSGLN